MRNFDEKIIEIQKQTKIMFSNLYIQFLKKIAKEEVFELEINESYVSFYSCDYLLERNKTYEIQKYEKDFFLIGQDGNLGFFIKNNSNEIYSNDLGAIGSLPMEKIGGISSLLLNL